MVFRMGTIYFLSYYNTIQIDNVGYETPEDVLRQNELLEAAGIQYLIADLDPSKELEALDNFAKEIIKNLNFINWYGFRRLREGRLTCRDISGGIVMNSNKIDVLSCSSSNSLR
jgi:hypothetical protein